jgi:tetratricopeptide (TPR) repeat protein
MHSRCASGDRRSLDRVIHLAAMRRGPSIMASTASRRNVVKTDERVAGVQVSVDLRDASQPRCPCAVKSWWCNRGILSGGCGARADLVSFGLVVAKKGGARAAAELYKRLNPKDWATRLAKAVLIEQPRPRPWWALARVLRDEGMLERLAGAVGDAGDWVDPDIVADLDAGLQRSSWRWRRLDVHERHGRAERTAHRILEQFIAALEPAQAVAVAYQHTRTSLTSLDGTLRSQGATLERALADQGAGHAEGRLARLRERLAAFPESVRPSLEAAIVDDPHGVEQIVVAVGDPNAQPSETLRQWVRQPPAWLGDPATPRAPVAWSVLGELGAAYGESAVASAAFENAANAGSGRRAYWLARAAWEAFLAEDATRASMLLHNIERPDHNPDPAVRVIAGVHGLLALPIAPELPSHGDPGAAGLDPAVNTPPSPEDARRRAKVRRDLAAWVPTSPVDRDLAARVSAQIEIGDTGHPVAQRYTAMLTFLGTTLSAGWIDDTALLIARGLNWRAQVGGTANRAKDLSRAESMAVTVRDHYRAVRRDSRVATREAVMAALLAGRLDRVIELGSVRFGQATPAEAHDRETACIVVEVALQRDPTMAQTIVDDPTQLPAGYVRAWAMAAVATQGIGNSNTDTTRAECAALWQAVVDAATSDDERWQALHGLADIGADDLPGLDGLTAAAPWMASQMRARAALIRGDAQAAIRFAYPHRDIAPAVAGVLADAYALLGELDAAVATLQQAAERFDFDDLIVHAATICARARRTEQAENLVTAVLHTGDAAWSGRARALELLGELQAMRGVWEDAIATWTTALQANPNTKQIYWNLANAHARRGDYGQAWAVLFADPHGVGAQTTPLEPPTAAAAHLLLVILYRCGDLATLVERGIDFLHRFGDDAENTGRMMGLLATATVEEAAGELDPDLLDRLRDALAAAAATHPTTPGLRVISGTPQDQMQQMIEIMRPDHDYARTVDELVLQAMRGQVPLGLAARAAHRPFAEAVVTHLAGVLTAVGDHTEHAAGVADAMTVLGVRPLPPGPGEQPAPSGDRRLLSVIAVPVADVVLDTSTLFVRGLLADVDAKLTAGIREFVLADDAYIDLLAAHDRHAMDGIGSFYVDPKTDQARVQPVAPRVRQDIRNSLTAMIALADSCRKRATPTTSHPDLDALQVDGDAQVAGLRLAAARQAALWADDVALRQMARMVGILTFSTAALLEACVQIGRVTQSEHAEAIDAMACGNVGDFAPDVRRARRLASHQGDHHAAMLGAMAKPVFWSNPRAAIEVYAALLADLEFANPPAIPDLVSCV